MRKGILLAGLLLILLLGVSSVWAADDSTPKPGTPADNECNVGGVLYREENQDGCPTVWYWKAGWFLARFNRGFISRADFPKEFESVLPPLVKPESAACWVLAASYGYSYSVLYFGPANVLGNVQAFNSSDCSGTPLAGFSSKASVIFASTPTDALTICSSLGPVAGLVKLDMGYPTAPADAYGCTIQ